ncbi:unnamed protein product [Gongylonema pulchrum]|uniref:Uncharacterized protein n=1 Tax=Gongylonema pulchrum TaxID=637853 RepID=A0A183DRK9_9BILA|nr:unnamed protein product [Gongylonema pulchrum]
MNKQFLFSRGAIPTLYRVLISSCSIPANTPNQQQRVEDIQVEAQRAVLQQQYAADFLLQKLTEMRPSILKQTLQILNKAALQDTNLPLFRDVRLRVAPDCETNFVERIILILKNDCAIQCYMNCAMLLFLLSMAYQKVAMDQLGNFGT